jgi:N-acetylmuramoyl-L-alanine amidase
MKGFLRCLLIGSIFQVCYIQGIMGPSFKPTTLNKIFYHQGIVSDKVVCYFDKEPLCNILPHRDDNEKPQEKRADFFLPMTNFAYQAQTMVQSVNKTKRDNYSIIFSEETKPIKGIKVSIIYNPEKIDCEYATCDVISNQKGLIFSFHHKDTLNLLKDSNNSVLRLVCNSSEKKACVMLDCGHGGNDEGTLGCNNAREKDVTMQVGTKLATLLKKRGYNVYLTRTSDTFVPLDHRTTLANQCQADIFVSLHSNAGPEGVSGIETYWMGQALLKRHAISSGNTAKRQELACLNRDSLTKQFAQVIHQNVIDTVSLRIPVRDRKVRESVAQVLLGTDMPSVLIEMGFLSNLKEASYLTNSSYQLLLAQGICNGIEAYYKTLKLV